MCGIYGQWDVNGAPLSLQSVQEATTLLRHRGPDDEGYLLGDTRQSRYQHCAGPDTTTRLDLPRIEQFGADRFDLALGFRRLSILDISPRGHQPMSSSDGRWWIVFNGEIYNYRELRAELAGYGHTFRGGSDTEVILAAFQQWGADCLHRFNGMWAFALWDTRERVLFLARDRFGVKPLHYVFDGGRFTFASEIKALVGAHGVPFIPDDDAVCRYLAWGRLPSPTAGQTFCRSVQSLPPAHCMIVAGDTPVPRRYYSLPESGTNGKPSPEAAAENYRELFTDAVRIRLRSDVPVGTCLSGGIDSSSIVCVINRIISEAGRTMEQVGERQKTFSAVYHGPGRYNESSHIETVLRATGAERNFTIPSAERLVADLARLIWHQDEPFGSTSIYAQWCVMARARERGVTVLLDGQGADEVLGGYRPFDLHLADLLRDGRYASALAASREISLTTGLSRTSMLSRALVRQAPRRYLDHLRGFRTRRTAGLLRPGFRHSQTGRSERIPANQGLADHLRELLEETSLPHLLRYEDRNGMAFGVEGRVPFVDYRLVEYALTQALPWCIHRGWTKWVLRQAMRDIVPPEIVWRRDKVGFETPEAEWLEALLERGPELLHGGAASRNYIEPIHANSLAQRWLRKKGETGPLWRLVNLELWLQAFNRPHVRSRL